MIETIYTMHRHGRTCVACICIIIHAYIGSYTYMYGVKYFVRVPCCCDQMACLRLHVHVGFGSSRTESRKV